MKKIDTIKLQVRNDARGVLVELIKPDFVDKTFTGQVFLTTAYPGKTKGSHYHLRKTEWYCVIKGTGMLTLVDISSKKKSRKKMTGDRLELVKIPPKMFHSIKNIGDDEMSLLVYVNEEFDPSDPDTIYEFS